MYKQSNQETRKIEKLNNTLHFLNSGRSSGNKHTIFFDKDEDIEKFSASKYFDTVEELKIEHTIAPEKQLWRRLLFVEELLSLLSKAMLRKKTQYC